MEKSYTSKWIRWISPLFFVLLAIVVSRCGNNNATTTTSPGTFADVYASTIKASNCAQCHSPGGTATADGVTLDFTSQTTSYTTLRSSSVGGGSSTPTCGGLKIVDTTGNLPTASYLAGVLFSDYNINNFAGKTGCKPYTVHLQDQNISASQEASIVAWIKAGSPNN